jgi:hypothetical protein
METNMSSRFVVEAEGRAVGLALRCPGGYRFFASDDAFRALERRIFPRFRALLHAVKTRKGSPPAPERR